MLAAHFPPDWRASGCHHRTQTDSLRRIRAQALAPASSRRQPLHDATLTYDRTPSACIYALALPHSRRTYLRTRAVRRHDAVGPTAAEQQAGAALHPQPAGWLGAEPEHREPILARPHYCMTDKGAGLGSLGARPREELQDFARRTHRAVHQGHRVDEPAA
jgi:hypothetical protein